MKSICVKEWKEWQKDLEVKDVNKVFLWEEKRSTLKEQLIIKLGAVSSRLEEQLTNASLEKLNVLTRNIFDITSEEDILRIIH